MIKEHKKILNIDEKSVTIEYLQDLIDMEFPISDMGRSWGNDVIKTDYLKITNVKFTTNVTPSISISLIHIYCDFYLKGKFLYNAWTGVESYKEYINVYLEKAKKEDCIKCK